VILTHLLNVIAEKIIGRDTVENQMAGVAKAGKPKIDIGRVRGVTRGPRRERPIGRDYPPRQKVKAGSPTGSAAAPRHNADLHGHEKSCTAGPQGASV